MYNSVKKYQVPHILWSIVGFTGPMDNELVVNSMCGELITWSEPFIWSMEGYEVRLQLLYKSQDFDKTHLKESLMSKY